MICIVYFGKMSPVILICMFEYGMIVQIINHAFHLKILFLLIYILWHLEKKIILRRIHGDCWILLFTSSV